MMKMPITIYAEMTPNPKAMKFVSDLAIISNGETYEFFVESDAVHAPLARVLFTFSFVKSVMLSQNFITINIEDGLDWNDYVLEVREYITHYLQADQPIINSVAARMYSHTQLARKKRNTDVEKESIPLEDASYSALPKPGEVRDINKKIIRILNDYVRPAVENDGGAIAFVSFNMGELTVRLSGACHGCPSSQNTLKYGVLNIVSKLLPQVTKVSAV